MSSSQIPPSIYFGGCAYGSIFYVGVYKAMLEKWGPDFADKTIICGDSSGAVMAVGIARKLTPEYLRQLYANTGLNAPYGIFYGGYSCFIENTIKKLLCVDGTSATTLSIIDEFDKTIHNFLNGKIKIGKAIWWHHIWDDKWKNIEELFICLKNTAYIPLLVPSTNEIGFGFSVDGAFCFSGTDLIDGDDSLYIAPNLYADISIPITIVQQVFPSDKIQQDIMIQKGYDAFMNWDGKMKKKVDVCKINYFIHGLLLILKYFSDIFNF